jgi:hypothetical protein
MLLGFDVETLDVAGRGGVIAAAEKNRKNPV